MTLRKKATGRGLKIPVGRLLAIGTVTTLARIVLQLLIPPGEQAVLEPSVFVMEGTMPVVFTVYGIFVYTALAALFLIIAPRMDGSAVSQGLRFGTALSLLWIVYLLEPLPHAAPLDRITYPVADSLVCSSWAVYAGAFWERHGPGQPAGCGCPSDRWRPLLLPLSLPGSSSITSSGSIPLRQINPSPLWCGA